MLNRVQSDQLSAGDRLDEISEILAAGLMRAVHRKSSQTWAPVGESSLHIPASKSADPLHVEVENRNE